MACARLLAFVFCLVFGTVAKGDASSLRGEVVEKILAIDTVEKVDTHLKAIKQKIDAENKSEPMLRLASAAIPILLESRGIVWRLGEIAAHNDPLYVAAMVFLRRTKYSAYLYGKHLDVLFDYLNLPYLKKKRFANIGDLQDFVTNTYLPLVKNFNQELAKITNGSKTVYPLEVDARIIGGSKPLLSVENLSFARTKAELLNTLRVSQQLVAGMHAFAAYDLDALLPFANRLMKDSLINSKYVMAKNLLFARSDFNLNLQTPKEVANILKRKEFKNLFTPRPKAEKHLAASLKTFQASVKTHLDLLDALDDQKRQETLLFDDRKTLRRTLEERAKVLSGKVTLISSVTGKKFTINVPKIFAGSQDLKKLFANNFHNVPEHYEIEGKSSKDDPVFVWHYDYGMPTGWPDPTFGGVLPNAKNKNIYDLMRTLSLTPSTAVFAQFLPVPGLPGFLTAL